MAFFTNKEFAEKCGMQTKHLSTYITRQQIKPVKKDGQDMFDGNDPLNKSFLAAKKGRSTEKQLIAEISKRPPLPNALKRQELTDDEEDEEDQSDQDPLPDINPGRVPSLNKSTTLLKHLDTLKRKQEISLLVIKEAKIKGTVIPSELVKPIFTQHNQSIVTEFKNTIDEIIRHISKVKDFTSEETAALKGQMVQCINRAVTNAIEMSVKSVDGILADYSEKKGIGERN